MTDEIFKDELLTDEQLDNVAGGTGEEMEADYFFMHQLSQQGALKFDTGENPVKEVERSWAKFGISVIVHENGAKNEYYNSEGKQISRMAALDQVLGKTNCDIGPKYRYYF
ncbi:MAG: hypothetical protein IKP64_13010 [Selenomonadaceae bacterium]|nr:hypothetical protein [Selenomonadaceae bacterium]MBR4384463.1 hypothetical protein [Selenomonadaceae bacterium]